MRKLIAIIVMGVIMLQISEPVMIKAAEEGRVEWKNSRSESSIIARIRDEETKTISGAGTALFMRKSIQKGKSCKIMIDATKGNYILKIKKPSGTIVNVESATADKVVNYIIPSTGTYEFKIMNKNSVSITSTMSIDIS
jgi:hypothetical protein